MSIKDNLEKEKSDRERAEGLLRIANLGRGAKELRATVRALTAELEDVRRELALSIGSDGLDKIHIPPGRFSEKGEVVPVLLFSDHHIEELVPLNQTNGRNEYSPEIAKARFEKLLYNSAKLIKHEASRSKIDKIVVWLGGDFMSGHIHADLVEITDTAPLETALIVHERLRSGLEFLAEETKAEQVFVPTSYGNHGRITQGRPRIATAASHNIEHMIYRTLARELSGDSRFVFDVQPTRLKILDVGGFKIRFSHGDDIRYAGGTGGFHAPLVNQIRRWNAETPVDLDCMGHYHTFVYLPGLAVMNGSLIGASEYSRRFGFEVPRQVLFYVDIDRKEQAGTYPVWVD